MEHAQTQNSAPDAPVGVQRIVGPFPSFEREGVMLYCADCLDVVPFLYGVDAVITDPPYGINFCHGGNDNSGIGKGRYATKFSGQAIEGDREHFDPSPWLNFPVVVLWGANHYADSLPVKQSWLVWDKRAASHHTNDFADCEMAWASTGCVARMFRHHWDGMMKASERGESRVHPTQKPVALMSWCLEVAKVPPNATVLDPFMGSGTTGIACVRSGRKFIGIEKDAKYFEIAKERIKKELRQGRLF